MLRVSPEHFDQAISRGIVTRGQADELWTFLTQVSAASTPEVPVSAVPLAVPVASGPGFTFTEVLYYFGGLLAIGAMSLFMTLAWSGLGGVGGAAVAIAYAAGALFASRYFTGKGFSTPAGILAALAIALVPLAVYGVQDALGMWPSDRPYRDYHIWIDWRWAIMELGTLLAGALVLFFYRLPFAVMPIAVTLWYMSMDFAPLLAGGNDVSWSYRKRVSLVFGLLMIAFAMIVDIRSRRRPDYGFWLYLFGTIAFWGALSMSDSNSQIGKLLYALLNVGLVFLGAVLARRIFTICGALGVCGYLGYLSYSVFKDSLLFPFALTALGLLIVVFGVWWQRHEHELQLNFRSLLPESVRESLG